MWASLGACRPRLQPAAGSGGSAGEPDSRPKQQGGGGAAERKELSAAPRLLEVGWRFLESLAAGGEPQLDARQADAGFRVALLAAPLRLLHSLLVLSVRTAPMHAARDVVGACARVLPALLARGGERPPESAPAVAAAAGSDARLQLLLAALEQLQRGLALHEGSAALEEAHQRAELVQAAQAAVAAALQAGGPANEHRSADAAASAPPGGMLSLLRPAEVIAAAAAEVQAAARAAQLHANAAAHMRSSLAAAASAEQAAAAAVGSTAAEAVGEQTPGRGWLCSPPC